MRNMRYYLEDKPQYLDDPEGEYWFEKKGTGGRLYLRLPGDADPNFAQIEAGKEMNLVEGTNVEHVHITGLTFRFTTPAWDISSSPWDFSTKPWGLRPAMHPGCVGVWGSGKDNRIANCRFEHVFFPHPAEMGNKIIALRFRLPYADGLNVWDRVPCTLMATMRASRFPARIKGDRS